MAQIIGLIVVVLGLWAGGKWLIDTGYIFGVIGFIIVSTIIYFATRKNTSINDKDLAELADFIVEKYGLEIAEVDIANNRLSFKATKENFDRKNRNFFDFKENFEKDLRKFLKVHNNTYKLLTFTADKNDLEVKVNIKVAKKENKDIEAPSKILNLAETLNIKDNSGDFAELVYFEEDKEADTMTLKYEYIDGIDNRKVWTSKIEVMKQILGFNFILEDKPKERVIEIIKVPRLKTALEFYQDGFKWEDYLEKGKIFEGMTSKGAYYRSLKGLTHTGVAGQSGSGKSVQLHLFLKSVFYNMEHFEKIYLGDLKGGLELSFLEDLGSDKLDFFGEAHEVLPIILNCELEMDARMAYMKANRIKNIVGNIILFVVDEYKQLNDLQMGKSGVSRQVGNLIVSKIDRISALGRAMNVKLFLQSQNFTTDSIESSTRNNIQSLVLMKTKNPEIQNACIPYSMREEMPNPADFTVGEKILLDSESGQTTHIQALFTEANEDITIDNSMKAYQKGMENQEEVKNIEEEVKPFKIKVLERHIANGDNLEEEVLEWYQAEYEKLTGKSVEEENEAIDVKEVKKEKLSEADKILKESEDFVNKMEEENEELLNEMDNLLAKLKS